MTARAAARAARLARSLQPELANIVAGVARMVVAAQRRLRPRQVARKGFSDFVTTVDVATERRLHRALLALLPDAGFLGEESPPSDLDREWVWVVDPIDGTSNFARGLPHFAVAVALLWRGTPHLAAVHCEPEGALYTARRGAGARRDGRRFRTPRGRIDDGAMFGCQWHRPTMHRDVVALLQQRGARLRLFGSTVVHLVDVATGHLDANVQEPGRLWDLAAPGLIALEAGAKVTDWDGRSVFPVRDWTRAHTPTLTAPPNVHAVLRRWLVRS